MTVSEIVARPIDAVQKLFQQAGCPSAAEADWGVPTHFEEAIAALRASEIPCLSEQTVDRLPHHSLVRFHGMVQDLLNPEYYVGAFQRPNGGWVTTKFSDPDMGELDDYDSNGQPVVWERRPVMCVPLPGLSSWALPDGSRRTAAAPDALSSSSQRASDGGAVAAAPADRASQEATALDLAHQPVPSRAVNKRERSSDADAHLDDGGSGSGTSDAAGVATPTAAAPHLEPEDSMQDTDPAGDQGPGPEHGAPGGGAPEDEEGMTRPRIRRREDRITSGSGAPPPSSAVAAVPLSPEAAAVPAPACAESATVSRGTGAAAESARQVPDEVPGSCMVYLYDNAPALVLHEMVEIVGIVSHVPQLAALEYDNQDPLLEHDLASLELTNGGGGDIATGMAHDNARGGVEPGGGGSGATRTGERLVFEAMRAAHPPTSKVMRLHAILVRRNPPLVPSLPQSAAQAPTAAANAVAPEPQDAGTAVAAAAAAPLLSLPVIAPLRERALSLLRWVLGGDAVAAEYVLMQLLGRVACRGDPAALGQLTMNLCRCPAMHPATSSPASTAAGPQQQQHSRPALATDRLGPRGPGPLSSALQAAVSCLVPLSVALPLTVESCNGASWAPQRDPVRERTWPSPLQLAPGTVVLLDETLMAPGQLKAEGVASLQALVAVCRQQELMYDFETFQHPVPVDLPLIVMTEGRSLLRESVHVRVPLTATQPFPSAEEVIAAAGGASIAAALAADTDDAMSTAAVAATGRISAYELATIRSYLAGARGQDGYELADGMSTVLEQYFVDARRAEAATGGNNAAPGGGNPAVAGSGGGGGITAEEFQTKLTLARLLVLTHGERRLTRQRWQQLLQLEHMRESRLRAGP